MCALLTDAARERMTRLVESQIRRSVSCMELMSRYARAVSRSASELRELRSAKISATTVTGDRATVAVTEPHQDTGAAQLVKTTNGWRVSKLIVRIAPLRKAIEG